AGPEAGGASRRTGPDLSAQAAAGLQSADRLRPRRHDDDGRAAADRRGDRESRALHRGPDGLTARARARCPSTASAPAARRPEVPFTPLDFRAFRGWCFGIAFAL